MHTRRRDYVLLVCSVIVAAGTLFHYAKIFRPLQVEEWRVQGRTTGNRSDLYPRWIGAREFWIHGRDPYSAEVTAEIQRGFYGHVLEAGKPGEWRDQQGFAYPLFTVFFLAPTITLPFEVVQRAAIVLFLITCAVVPWLWGFALGIRLRPIALIAAFLLCIGNWQVIEALYLQQLTLIVSLLVAAGVAGYVSGRYALSGILFAIGMIKPQIGIPVVCWLMLLSLSKWSERKKFVFAWVAGVALLVGASLVMMPNWLMRWKQAAEAYAAYVDVNTPILTLLIGKYPGLIVSALVAVFGAWFCWRNRRAEPNSDQFRVTLSLVMCCTVVLPPIWHYYEQVLLYPAFLMGVYALGNFCLSGEQRLGLWVTICIAGSIWVVGPALSLIYLLGRLPDWAALKIVLFPVVLAPVAILAMSLILAANQLQESTKGIEGDAAAT